MKLYLISPPKHFDLAAKQPSEASAGALQNPTHSTTESGENGRRSDPQKCKKPRETRVS